MPSVMNQTAMSPCKPFVKVAAHMNPSFGVPVFAITLFTGLTLGPTSTHAETIGYVISTFHTATYGDPKQCPKGGNGASIDIDRRVLGKLGYSRDEINYILQEEKDRAGRPRRELSILRGAGGTPVDPFNDPASAEDPRIEIVSGRYAPGFNLDGRSESGFEDPYTREQGIDNQLFRALGCFQAYNVSLPVKPFYEDVMWDTMIDTMPAWVLTISGENLRADGDVTVTFDRSLQHVRRNAAGGALFDATYVLENNSRSHAVFRGTIKDDVLTLQPGTLRLEGEAPILTELHLQRMQLRLKFEDDGTLAGFVGGYQPWMDFFYMVSSAGEINIGLDIPGVYYAFKALADYDPDPKAAQKMWISSAYRVIAVPAYLASVEAKLIARSVTRKAVKTADAGASR